MYTFAYCCQQWFLSLATALTKQIMLSIVRYFSVALLWKLAIYKTTDARGAVCDTVAAKTQPRTIYSAQAGFLHNLTISEFQYSAD